MASLGPKRVAARNISSMVPAAIFKITLMVKYKPTVDQGLAVLQDRFPIDLSGGDFALMDQFHTCDGEAGFQVVAVADGIACTGYCE